MEGRKVYITHMSYTGLPHDEDLQFEGERIWKCLQDPAVVMVIILADDIDLTVGQVGTMERLFKGLWKERITVIY